MARIEAVEGKKRWVRIYCDGNCGRYVELRKAKVSPADYYICGTRESGKQCEESLPPRQDGQMSRYEFQAASYFHGITYFWPSPEELASLERARGMRDIALAIYNEINELNLPPYN